MMFHVWRPDGEIREDARIVQADDIRDAAASEAEREYDVDFDSVTCLVSEVGSSAVWSVTVDVERHLSFRTRDAYEQLPGTMWTTRNIY